MALKWHAELLQQGLSDVTALPKKSEAVYLLEDWRCIGVIVFVEDSRESMIWIYLSYVDPEFRNRGVFRMLWDELVAIGTERQLIRITGGTHHTNHDMQKVMARMGRKLTFLMYDFLL